jgi:2-polyprenyl-6-hydroxyphenyl methylase / 3-demethylubiquinone-9 3-methyltransferase
MQLSEEQRRDMHSGDYVSVVANMPISRLTRLLPYLDLQPSHRVADFASGAGNFAELIHDRVKWVDGIDFTPDFVEAARRRAAERSIRNVAFHCQSIVEFCAGHANEYDVVTAIDFSEHIYDEDFVSIFSGAYNILKPGGRLYVYTPNLTFFWEWMKGVGLAKQIETHIAVRNARQYMPLLERCGFSLDEIQVRHPSHFNVFRSIHWLRHLPRVGKYFQAKLMITCRKK